MQVMQGLSTDADELRDFDLKALSRRLQLAGMPVQAVIAREAGVSQSTVSRAAQGLIRGQSLGAARLWTYTTARIADLEVPASSEPIARPSAKGEIVSPRSRARPKPRRRTVGPEVQEADRQSLVKAAVDGLKRYLDDAFDPQLVIEQLAVLRRAQDRGPRGTIEP